MTSSRGSLASTRSPPEPGPRDCRTGAIAASGSPERFVGFALEFCEFAGQFCFPLPVFPFFFEFFELFFQFVFFLFPFFAMFSFFAIPVFSFFVALLAFSFVFFVVFFPFAVPAFAFLLAFFAVLLALFGFPFALERCRLLFPGELFGRELGGSWRSRMSSATAASK